MSFCSKCGKEIADPSGRCLVCDPVAEPVAEQKMPCPHCGAEVEVSTTVCAACGCPIMTAEQAPQTKKTAKSPIKLILLIAAAVVVLVGLVIGGIAIKNNARRQEIIDKLAGETFEYYDYEIYTALNASSLDIERLTFDGEGECTEYSYYNNTFTGNEFDNEYALSYKIVFKNGKEYLEAGASVYEIQYNYLGEIDGLYDTNYDKLLEKE